MLLGKNKIPSSMLATVFFVLSNILVKGISLITLPLFTRLFTVSEYGTLTLFNSWLTILAIFTTLTIWGGAFNVGLVNAEKNTETYVSAVQSLGFSISLLFLIFGILFKNVLSNVINLSPFLIICMLLEFMMMISYNVWMAKQRFLYKYKALVLISILYSIINPLLGMLFVTCTQTYKVEAKIFSDLLMQLILGVFFYIYNWKKGKIFFDKKIWKFAFRSNIVLIPHYLSMQVLNQSDRLMIGNMCGNSAAGMYGVAYNFAMLLSLITTAIESSYTPFLFTSIKKGATKSIERMSTLIILLVAILCLGLICIIPDVFVILLPDSYKDALYCVPPIAMGAYVFFLYIVVSKSEFYYREEKYVTITSSVFAVLNLVLNYLFIPIFGYIAAAYTTLVCYLGISIVHAMVIKSLLKRNRGIEGIYNFKYIFFISLIFCVACLSVMLLYSHSIIRYGVIVCVILLLIVKREEICILIKKIVPLERGTD